jgi:hypothetical protein
MKWGELNGGRSIERRLDRPSQFEGECNEKVDALFLGEARGAKGDFRCQSRLNTM